MKSSDQPVPRIVPLTPDQWDAEACDALAAFPKSFKFVMDGWNAGDRQVRGVNVLGTLAHYPALAKAFSTFNAHVAGSSTLPVREREIVILRLSWLRRSEYEYAQHVILGRRAGLGDDELQWLQQGPEAAGWPAGDADLVRAVDELHGLSRITADTWARLARRYDQSQLLDLLFLVGCYDALALAINSLATPAEGDAAALLDADTRQRMMSSRAVV